MIFNKKLTSLAIIVVTLLVTAGCQNPKADATEVCDCYQNVLNNPKLAEDYGFHRCMALSADKVLKYKNKPEELLEYNIQLDSCTKSFTGKGKNK